MHGTNNLHLPLRPLMFSPIHFLCPVHISVSPLAKNHTPPLIKYDLTTAAKCNTLLDMKSATLTIRLDKDLDVLLSKASKRSGRNRSEIAREALRRQLRLQQFEELRKRIMPFAEARGFLTDEDIFSQIS